MFVVTSNRLLHAYLYKQDFATCKLLFGTFQNFGKENINLIHI